MICIVFLCPMFLFVGCQDFINVAGYRTVHGASMTKGARDERPNNAFISTVYTSYLHFWLVPWLRCEEWLCGVAVHTIFIPSKTLCTHSGYVFVHNQCQYFRSSADPVYAHHVHEAPARSVCQNDCSGHLSHECNYNELSLQASNENSQCRAWGGVCFVAPV